MDQGYPMKLIYDVSQFNFIRFEEISSCGDVIKKIFYSNGSSGGSDRNLLIFYFTS